MDMFLTTSQQALRPHVAFVAVVLTSLQREMQDFLYQYSRAEIPRLYVASAGTDLCKDTWLLPIL